MPTFDESFPGIEAALADHYGRLDPRARHDDPFAAVLTVLLERSVDARKVAKALDGLGDSGWLEPRALAEAEPGEIAEALATAGVSVPAKALAPIRRLAKWLVDRHGGSGEALGDQSLATSQLREELSGLNGIGPATADAILLFGLGRAVYPVDRASYRILVRHGWLDMTADYDEARSVLERPRRDDPGALASLSEGMERVGREFCRVRVAKCERCPLRPFLPEGGPIEPDVY